MSGNTALSYEYQPVDASNNEIRVIKILPGAETDGLECRIEHIPLNDSQGYDALSYTWHDPTLFPEEGKPGTDVLLLNRKRLDI